MERLTVQLIPNLSLTASLPLLSLLVLGLSFFTWIALAVAATVLLAVS